MKLTSHTNYAIRMLMFCASKQELARVAEIADFYDLPQKFLFKILGGLTKAGFMETVRGRNGGIKLARPASEISLGDVVREMEENLEMAESKLYTWERLRAPKSQSVANQIDLLSPPGLAAGLINAIGSSKVDGTGQVRLAIHLSEIRAPRG